MVTPVNIDWTRQERRQWASVLFVGSMVVYTCRTVVPLCLAVMAKEFEWDKTQSGTVLGCFFWGYTMTQFLGGYLSDRIGGEVVMPIAACVWSLLTFWTPQFAYLSTDKYLSLQILVMSRVIIGMAQGFHFPSLSSVMSRRVPEQDRAFTYSLICSGSPVGTLLIGSVGSLLLESYGWQSVFYFVGFISVSWMLYMRFVLVANHRKKYLPTIAEAGVVPVVVREKVPWTTLFVKPAFWGLLLGHFVQCNAFFILLSWAPTYFHENYPDAKGWIFNVVPWVVSMISSIFGGWLADFMLRQGYTVTFVRKFMESLSLLSNAVGLIALSYTSTFSVALFCVALAVAGGGFHNSGILINAQDIAPQHAGSVFGIMNMAGAIPGFVGVYMAGVTLEATKSWAAVFNQTAALCVFGWVVYMITGTGKKII